MVNSTPQKKQNKTKVISMNNVKQVLPSEEVLDFIRCFARTYSRPAVV